MTVVSANDYPLVSVELHVPFRGAWWAHLEFVDAPDIEPGASIDIAMDELHLTATFLPDHDGTHGEHRRALAFAGAAGWGTELAAQHYRSDTGVRARLVVEDAARLAGETLGTFEPADERLGIHYVRQAGLARRVLEDGIGDVIWWVDYAGVTHVAETRPDVEVNTSLSRVLDYDPLERLVTLEIQTADAVVIGSTLSEGLDEPQTARDLVLTASPQGLRLQAWTGAGRYGRADSRAFAAYRRYADAHLWGSWRYRVTGNNGTNLDCRPVLSAHGLPELVNVEFSPGLPGLDSELANGTEVLIEFVEGNRAIPRVVGFAGRDQDTWSPTQTVIDAESAIKLGKNANDAVALAPATLTEMTVIKTAIQGATIVAGDGGAKFKADLIAALASWPGQIAATKVQAE